MTNLDLHPLLRMAIGFDETLLNSLQEQSRKTTPGYPPYNIEKISEDEYQLSIAVAGFSQEEIEITAQRGSLTVKATPKATEEKTNVLYRGIARRNFTREFRLGEYIEVENAQMENGILSIGLKRIVPDYAKPRTISIQGNNVPKLEASVA